MTLANCMLIAREVDYGVMLLKALVRTLLLTLGFALEGQRQNSDGLRLGVFCGGLFPR